MHQRKSKKILIYFFLFILVGTLNQKNFEKKNVIIKNEIKITGLEGKNYYQLKESLNYLKTDNLLFLNKPKLIEIINSNSLVHNFSVFIKYPSTIDIKIFKAKFLATIKKNQQYFLLGSNGKFTKTYETQSSLPIIFGDFEIKEFFELKKILDDNNFEYKQIKRLLSYKTGRWDIETHSGLIIKLPKDRLENSVRLALKVLEINKTNKIKLIDLRQNNQVIIND